MILLVIILGLIGSFLLFGIGLVLQNVPLIAGAIYLLLLAAFFDSQI